MSYTPPALKFLDESPAEKLLTLWIHCSCGTSLVGSTSNSKMADALMQLFSQRHCGDGHFPVSPEEPCAKRSLQHGQEFPHLADDDNS